MKTIIVIGFILIATYCSAYQDKEVVFIERSGVIIPVEINKNGTTFVRDSSSSTMIMDNPFSTTIMPSSGSSTTIYKDPFRKDR